MDILKFGTDGWRDIIADRFTYCNVARCAQAYAEHLLDHGQPLAVVGYDTRFGGRRFAGLVTEVLAANGVDVMLSSSFVPTPALSFAVTHFQAGGGVMLTASHNPPEYNGVKLKGPYGGTATDNIYQDVAERVAHCGLERVRRGKGDGKIEEVDVRPAYFEALLKVLDIDALRDLQGTVVHDAMGGAASGWLQAFAGYAGLNITVEQLRNRPDPHFHGVNPEPLPPHLGPSIARAREGNLLFVSANDGDGDRLGVVLPGGQFFNSHQIFAVLLDLMQRRGDSGRVVKTFTVTRLIERLCEARGLQVLETPVGFKHIAQEMLQGGVLIGGEESGGIGVGNHIPERDGLANTLLLLEAMARSGTTLDLLFTQLEREAQWQHAYDRLDLHLESTEASEAVLDSLLDPPATLAGRRVTKVERLDGIKLNLGDDTWLLFRASGTEPLLRVYCEGPTMQEVESVLSTAEALAKSVPA